MSLLRHKNTRIAIASQAASSLTSLVAGVSVARVSTVEEFGAFGLMFGTYLLISTLLKSFLVEPLVVTANRTGSSAQGDDGAFLGASLQLAAPCALLLGLALWAMDVALEPSWIAVGCVAVLFGVSQEAFKAYCYGTGRERTALRSDSSWMLAQLVVLALAIGGRLSVGGALAGWGAGAVIGLVVAAVSVRAVPRFADGRALAARSRRFGLSWMADSAMVNVVGQGVPWVLAAVATFTEVAAFRGALMLLGPTTVLFSGLRLAALPVLARSALGHVRALTLNLTAIYAAIGVTVGLALLALPDAAGMELLGESWDAARSVLPYAVAWRLAASLGIPPLLGLRAIGETRSILLVRTGTSVLTIGAAFTGAVLDGARGALLGLTIAATLMLPLWFRTLNRAISRQPDRALQT